MLTKLTLGAAIVATAALLTPVSAAPPVAQSLAPASGQVQEGLAEQVHWRHRHRHYRHRHHHHHHYRHCRRVCHGHMHWSPYRGWHCHGHYHTRCHWH